MLVLFCKIITRARKDWVGGDATELARRNWLCSVFSCGVKLSCAGTLADDIDRSSAPPLQVSWFLELAEELASSENRSSQRMDVSLFLKLERELGLIGRITLCFLRPGDRGGVAADSDAEF